MGVRVEAEISGLKVCIEERSESLATLERTQQELRNMLLMLCGNQAITVASAAPSTSTLSASSPVVGLSNLMTSRGSASVPGQSSTTLKAPGKSLLIYTIKYLTAQQVRLVRQQGLRTGRKPAQPSNLKGGHEFSTYIFHPERLYINQSCLCMSREVHRFHL